MATTTKTDLTATQEQPVTPPSEAKVVNGSLPPEFSGKRRIVTLSAGHDELGKLPWQFGINGFVIEIKRNERVSIPEEFVQTIRERSQQVYDSQGMPAGEMPRFNLIDYGPAA